MIIADLDKIEGRRYPARRRTQNIVGGASPIQASNFSVGMVTLDPRGGQVPWHNQEQEEVYFILEGVGEALPGRGAANPLRRPGRLHPPPRLPPTDQPRRHPVAHDLLLRPGRRGGALAPGARGNPPQSRGGRPSPAPRRPPPMCRQTLKKRS